MRRLVARGLVGLALAAAASGGVAPGIASAAAPPGNAFGMEAPAFASRIASGAIASAGAGLGLAWESPPNPLLPPAPLEAALGEPTSPGQMPTAATEASNTRYILPVLLSAVVPGTGEIVTGHWLRGIPFVAADVATWILYGHFHNEGVDWRSSYEQFADAHWHYSGDANGNGVIDVGENYGWQENLKDYYDGQYNPNYDYWDETQPYNCTCPYIPKEQDRQHYYENIGKYLYYYPGWEDWRSHWNGDPATSDSPLRIEYDSMRLDSNESFDNATNMVYVAMATRLASMIQTVFLVRGETRSIELHPMKVSGRGAGLRLSLRY